VIPWESITDGQTTSLVLIMTQFIVLGHLEPGKILTLILKEDLYPQIYSILLFCGFLKIYFEKYFISFNDVYYSFHYIEELAFFVSSWTDLMLLW